MVGTSNVLDFKDLIIDDDESVDIDAMGKGEPEQVVMLTDGIDESHFSQLELPFYSVGGYNFPLGDVDLIFGVAWLETFRDVKVNWADMAMQFSYRGTPVTVKGDPTLTPALVSIPGKVN
ncbi:hypothetical protein GH714_004695 [Hevea brasiliensis]|uniref:Uncharacterized protein n=1 Tax=Hevea brasiliensis TaxID=3981 RepID=A0A6A6LWL2_HEVBR|nr:hypothetical protein GH714_004695 [Hevea brasiliensis]